MDLTGLTTPSRIDWKLMPFIRKLSVVEPVFVEVQPELWSKQSSCEMNVQKLIERDGGNAVVGYKIWYLRNQYIEGERHVIYQKEGIYRDPTFNVDGEMSILFVPDADASTSFEARPLRVRAGLTQRAQQFCRDRDVIEARHPVPRMSSAESWERMPSYEEWLAGVRVPNVIPVAR